MRLLLLLWRLSLLQHGLRCSTAMLLAIPTTALTRWMQLLPAELLGTGRSKAEELEEPATEQRRRWTADDGKSGESRQQASAGFVRRFRGEGAEEEAEKRGSQKEIDGQLIRRKTRGIKRQKYDHFRLGKSL